MERIDPEPPEPFMTTAELFVVGVIIVMLVFCAVLWWAERQTADMKDTIDKTLGGPW